MQQIQKIEMPAKAKTDFRVPLCIDSKGIDLNKAQLDKIVDTLSKVKISPENEKRKAVIASILRRVESRLDHLQSKEKIDTHATSTKIQVIRAAWAIQHQGVDKNALREKLKRAVERAKIFTRIGLKKSLI